MSEVLGSQAAMEITLLIEEIRRKSNEANRHIKDISSRDDMKLALMEFYKRQGIDSITQEMIEAGIKSYEESRFKHKRESKSSFFNIVSKLIIDAYPSRFSMITKSIAIILFFCSLPMLVSGINGFILKSNISSLVSDIDQSKQAAKSSFKSLKLSLNHFDEIASSEALLITPYSKGFLSSQSIKIKSIKVKILEAIGHADEITYNNPDIGLIKNSYEINSQAKRWAESGKKPMAKINKVIDEITHEIDSISSILSKLIAIELELSIINSTELFKKKSTTDYTKNLYEKIVFSISIGDPVKSNELLLELKNLVYEKEPDIESALGKDTKKIINSRSLGPLFNQGREHPKIDFEAIQEGVGEESSSVQEKTGLEYFLIFLMFSSSLAMLGISVIALSLRNIGNDDYSEYRMKRYSAIAFIILVGSAVIRVLLF